MPSHILGMDKEIDKGLAAFIATLQGPFGQIPFERAVVRHLPFFLGLRQRGLTWTRVASLLTARGVRRANGHPISVEQLRGWSRGKCVTRKCQHQVGSTRPAWPIEAKPRASYYRPPNTSATDDRPPPNNPAGAASNQSTERLPPWNGRMTYGHSWRAPRGSGAVSTTQMDEKGAAAIRRMLAAASVRGVWRSNQLVFC